MMKIRRFALQNITSYRERVVFDFDERLNILIGPNGGGKSNLQRTLALVLSNYFIHQYDFRSDDNEAKVEPVSLWTKRALERSLPPFVGDDSDQMIEIVLVPENSDIDNIKVIGANLERFNKELEYYEHPVDVYEPFVLIDKIQANVELVYHIRNLVLEEPARDSAAWGFREYLRTFFIYMRLAPRLADVHLTSPVFFFFSERTSKGRVEVQTNQFSEEHYYSGYRSAYQAATGENTNLLQWGAQHFARLHWQAVTTASQSRELVAREVFGTYSDVSLLTRYLAQLGYEWDFMTDRERVSYAFALRKHVAAPWMTPDMFSSGEREIVHFLLAMFALNVKDGVVLLDEPELHLHPRWQRVFLGLFREIAPSRNNQFVITTHSPVFVTPDTINSITRIYQKPGGGSARITLKDVDLPEKKSLVRMINSQNNERVFFADQAVLVEGISDRLVVASLLDAGSVRFANNEALEIIEVGGKGNFAEYRRLLDALNTPTFIVADLDYLRECGDTMVRALFHPDGAKAWESLRQKKSVDAKSAIAAITRAVDERDLDTLSDFLVYLTGRHSRLVESLTSEEVRVVEDELERLLRNRIFILRHGEIEDYLPPGHRDVKDIVALTVDRNWTNKISDSQRRAVLGRLISEILALSREQGECLISEMRSGTVSFPEPMS